MSLTKSFPWLSTLEKYSRIGYFNPDLLTFSSNRCPLTKFTKTSLHAYWVTAETIAEPVSSYDSDSKWKKNVLQKSPH